MAYLERLAIDHWDANGLAKAADFCIVPLATRQPMDYCDLSYLFNLKP